MIQILFSLSFDKGVWRGSLVKDHAQVGLTAVGELGLLDLLETQLGLKLPETPSYQRKVDYLQALRAANSTSKFYSASLSTDPMAATEHLLELRDTLVESLWQGDAIAEVQRVNDLCEVEKQFSNRSGKSDRLRNVLEALKKRNELSGIASITLFEEPARLSALWTAIIQNELTRLRVKIEHLPTPEPKADVKSDLGKLSGLRKKEAAPTGDNSLFLLTGRDPWESARFVAARLSQLTAAQLNDCVIIAPEGHRGILRTALQAQGIPFGGQHVEVSYARPALQIVILSLTLAWEPKDPSAALALLTIEGSPVPKAFRYQLVRSLGDSLAVGGKSWTEALDHVVDKLLKEAPTDDEKEKIVSRKSRVNEWFSGPALPFEKGIPLDEVVTICARASKWLRQKWVLSRTVSFREAYDLCELLANLAKNLGEKTISRERLVHLLIDSVGDGISAAGLDAQSKGPRIVGSPGDIVGQVETLIWWDFTAATIHGHPEPFFSLGEIEKLRSKGIAWPNSEDTAIASARHWSTPFSQTTKQLLMVNQLLDSDGNPEGFHPVLNEMIPKKARQQWMAAIHVNLMEKQSLTVTRFLSLAGAESVDNLSHTFQTRPSWKLRPESLSLREAESASSLDQLLGCELAYVLRYEAGLDGEDRASLQYDARIMGIIAHEVISNVFKKGAAPSPSSARKTAESLIDDVIRDKAPQLYQRDKVRELTELKSIVLQDITAYASFLEANKLTIEASELDVKKSEKKLGSVHLVGKIDHVLNDENNNTIIMDHKFGSAKWKERDLAEGKSLQLALYSTLVNRGKDPTLAYHMITDSRILVLNSEFKKAVTVKGPEAREILKEAADSLSKKEKILKSGNLLAPGLSEENEKERFQAPCRYCEFDKICGLAWKVST